MPQYLKTYFFFFSLKTSHFQSQGLHLTCDIESWEEDRVCSEPIASFYNTDYDRYGHTFPGRRHSPIEALARIYLLLVHLFIQSMNIY